MSIIDLRDRTNAALDRISADTQRQVTRLQEELDRRSREFIERSFAEHEVLRQELRAHEQAGAQEIARLDQSIVLRTEYLQERIRILLLLTQQQLDQRFAAIQQQILRRFDAVEQRIRLQGENWTQVADLLEKQARQSAEASFQSQREAIAKSEVGIQKQFEAHNERFQQMAAFATQLSSQAGSYMLRAEGESAIRALTDKTESQVTNLLQRIVDEVGRSDASRAQLELRLTSRLDLAEGRLLGTGEQRGENRLNVNTIISALALIIVAAGVIVAIVHK